ncbi:ADP-polyphosphate phosphotransferase [Novosphingobium sediminicola]|nr:ADP-polyphosphate phosphotransferase [Novosphingobium sediminicola]
MEIALKTYRIPEGKSVDLKKRKTHVRPAYESKADYETILADHVARLSDLQQRHYAANAHGLLIIFQAMDAAGKDGVIRHVMSGVGPQGCQVFAFKRPSDTELEHDFLWRATDKLPARGEIAIFNRSYYEGVLVVKVHRKSLKAEIGPDSAQGDELWQERYRSIRDFERHLHVNGTRIVKIFLHVSKEEQRQRFLARIEEPHKNWKLTPADIEERQFWKDYRRAYEACIEATSTKEAPWYVVPADDKENARLIVSQIVLDALEGLRPDYPDISLEKRGQLQAIRAQLLAEGE